MRKPKWTCESVGEYERSLKPPEQPKPKRTWVGLTDEEIVKIWIEHGLDGTVPQMFTYEIEAKLKEKNT